MKRTLEVFSVHGSRSSTGTGNQPLAPLLAVVLLLVAGLTGITACEDTQTIDMTQVASDGGPTSEDSRPALRIAIGAMISPETTWEYYEDLMRLIANRMDRRPLFAQRRTYDEINELVKNRKTDVAFVCSGPYTKGNEEFGMELLVVPVAHGKKVYHSYIIVPRDSTATSFDDLRNSTFAFTDPQSNTGCLVPTYMLATRDETPETFFRKTVFTYSHDNSIREVAEKQVDAAAVDSLIWEFMSTIEPELAEKTKVIEKSPPYGIPPVVVNPDMDEDFKERLRKVFLALHEDGEAKPLLDKLQIERFAPGDDTMYDSVREMRRWVDRHTGK